VADKFRRLPVKVSPSLIGKWGSEDILSEGYIPFPKKLLRTLSEVFYSDDIKCLAALLAIVDFNREGQYRNPTRDYLAFIAGLSDEEFAAAIGDLMQGGLLVEGDIPEPEDYVNYDFSPLVKKICGLTSTEEEAFENRPPDLP